MTDDEVCCLLSIKLEYANKILDGVKLFEYRKKGFKRNINKIFLYVTHPTSEIIGYFHPGKILYNDIESIWEETNLYSGLKRDTYLSYCNGASHIYAISIFKVVRFTIPINPYQTVFRPPQSFYYI
ncbi:MAG: hypothetical protein APF81_05820 [Desulfosporosinus sp. BRH_c37]|nr:MAG: hypothetical protein APF81_05820 [Desulfosporosinus sp. BRH_c37]